MCVFMRCMYISGFNSITGENNIYVLLCIKLFEGIHQLYWDDPVTQDDFSFTGKWNSGEKLKQIHILRKCKFLFLYFIQSKKEILKNIY